MDLITPDFGVVFWQSLIILLVIFILGKFAWKPIIGFIQERENTISDSLEKAEQTNKAFKTLDKQKAAIIAEASVEKNKIISEAMSIRKSILDKADEEAASLTAQTIAHNKALIEEEQKTAKAALKEEISFIAIQLAESLMKAQVKNKEESNRMIESFLKQA